MEEVARNYYSACIIDFTREPWFEQSVLGPTTKMIQVGMLTVVGNNKVGCSANVLCVIWLRLVAHGEARMNKSIIRMQIASLLFQSTRRDLSTFAWRQQEPPGAGAHSRLSAPVASRIIQVLLT